MLCNTKLANGCRVTEKAEFLHDIVHHIVETIDGYIIRISYRKSDKTIVLDSVLNRPAHYNLINRLIIPSGNYKALRAAYKAMITLAPLHNLDRRRY